MSTSAWTWSHPHQDYYCVTYDEHRQPVYHWWSKQTTAANEPVSTPVQASPFRHDSVSQQDYGSNTAQMPERASQDSRVLPGFIPGTPHTGWYDLLDPSYRMRTGAEAQSFFVVGKVFAMLYTETAGDTLTVRQNDDAYTVVRFNEIAHTNIRRFVVVQVKRGFVKACGIGTYSGRGALKDGCSPHEHSIVYFSGTDPAYCYLPGEYESGMTKDPIEVEPVDRLATIRRESRIRFGKTYPIEMNVKVKDIGRVHPYHLTKLLQYWTDEDQAQ